MSKAMMTLVPLNGTRVVRDGHRVRPQIGKPFEYTSEEVEQLKSGGAKFRKPADETAAVEPASATATRTTRPGSGSTAEGSQAGARGGKKAATANKSDAKADDGKADAGKDDDL